MIKALEQKFVFKIKKLKKEAKNSNTEFNKGYFEGRAESLQQALNAVTKDNLTDALAALEDY